MPSLTPDQLRAFLTTQDAGEYISPLAREIIPPTSRMYLDALSPVARELPLDAHPRNTYRARRGRGAYRELGASYSDLRALVNALREHDKECAWQGDSACEVQYAITRLRMMLGGQRALAWLSDRAGYELGKCHTCDEWHDEYRLNTVAGYELCARCTQNYFQCPACDALSSNDGSQYDESNSETLCSHCYSQRYTRCRDCDEENNRDNMTVRSGRFYCNSCYNDRFGSDPDEDDEDGPIRGVYEYGTKVHLKIQRPWLFIPGQATDAQGNRRTKAATLWMGFELEVNTRDNVSKTAAASAVNEALAGRGILANDSSIEGTGFEIISLPATLEYHQKMWGKEFFARLQSVACAWGNDTCGMHVHVSRRALSALQAGRAMNFLHADCNREFVEHVAGRTETEYCRKTPKRISQALPQQIRDQYRTIASHVSQGLGATGCDDQCGHYSALNFENKDTLELRIFQGNVAQLGFLKNLEFTHALFAWARCAPNTALTSRAFLAWLDQERGRYPNLAQWAVRESLLKSRHVIPQLAPMAL